MLDGMGSYSLMCGREDYVAAAVVAVEVAGAAPTGMDHSEHQWAAEILAMHEFLLLVVASQCVAFFPLSPAAE